jgi:FemAB-related protein (PEP-CTERM system-associated)
MSGAASEPVTIRVCEPCDESRWDAFVEAHAWGSPMHLIAWRHVIEESFGYKPQYLLMEQDGRIRAVLPLFLVDTLLTGKVLLSTPFAVYGGVLADSDEASRAMHEHVRRLGESMQVQHIELRNRDESQCGGWPRVDRYVTFVTTIGADADAILGALPRETRRMTRRALEQDYEIRQTRERAAFERLYAENLRKLGTPAFPRRYFSSLLRHFPGAEVQEVTLGGKVVAAVLSFYFRDQVLPYYGASDPAFNRANPNNYMYYRLMVEARARGLNVFDFGRSKRQSGSYLFKAHWGMQEIELPYEIHLVRRKSMPNFSPTNPKFELAIKVWQRLPLWVTRLIGPPLLRMVP